MPERSIRDLIAQGFQSQLQDVDAINADRALPQNRPSVPKTLSVRDLIQKGFQSSTEEKQIIEPRGPIDETVSALGAGFAQTGQAIGGTMEMLGVPGGQKIREEWQAIGELPSLQRPTYLQQDDSIRGGDWRWWVRNIGENVPNFVIMYGVGGGAGTVAKMAGAGIKAISRAALAGGFGGSFTMEAGSQYAQAKSEMIHEGFTDPDEIERVATMEGLVAGTANAIIEMIPIKNVFGRTPVAQHILKRILKQGILEGSTESIQEGVNIFAEKIGHKPDQQWSDQVNRILTSGIVGGVLGGGIGGPMGATQHSQQVKQYNALADQYDLKENIYQWKDDGVSDQEIADRVTARLQKIQEANDQFNQSLKPFDEKKSDVMYAIETPAQPLPAVPEIDTREMVDYVLYGEGKYKPPAVPIREAVQSAKERVLSAFGMRRKTQAEPVNKSGPETDMTTTGQATTDIGKAPQNQLRQDEDQRKAARVQGEGLFNKVLTDLTAEGQEQIETARLAEEQAREAEQAQLAAEEARKVSAAIGAADQQIAQTKDTLAGSDPRKQAIVDEVMGLSDRRLFTAAQTEAGWEIIPDGRGAYSLSTPQGNVPVNLLQIRQQLAARRIADHDAKLAQQQADEEATRRMEAEAAERKTRRLEKERIAYLRKSLQGLSLTQGQVDSLEQMRDQLTADEIRRLELHKRDLAQKEAARAGEAPPPETPIEPDAILEEKPNPEKAHTEQDAAAQETALIDAMLMELDGAATGGLLLEDETTGEKTRTSTGIGWISDTNKKGWSIGTADARTILTKAREGKPLTGRQQQIYNDLVAAAGRSMSADRAAEIFWVEKGFEPVRNRALSVDEMTTGDAFVIGGEEYKVADIDDDGNVTLKDGTIKKVKAGTQLSGVDYVKIDQEAGSFDPDQLFNETAPPPVASSAPKSGTMEDTPPAEIVEPAATSQAEKTEETPKSRIPQGVRTLGARPARAADLAAQGSTEGTEAAAGAATPEGAVQAAATTGNLSRATVAYQSKDGDFVRWKDNEDDRLEYELNPPEIAANPGPYWEAGIRHKGWAKEHNKFKTKEEAVQWLDAYDTGKIDKDFWGPGAQYFDELFGKGTYEKIKGKITPDNDAKIKAAIADAKKNGPTNEFRALFGGIDPVKAGTTNEAVAKLAGELGLRWEAPATNPRRGPMAGTQVAKQQTQPDVAQAQAEIPGASYAETWGLTNPVTEISKPLAQQVPPKNEDLFAEGATEAKAAAVPPADEKKMIQAKDIQDWQRKHYYDGETQVASSRTTPMADYPWDEGTWSIDDHFGPYGRMVEQLRRVPIADLSLSEEDYTKINYEGRGDDAQRYSDWIKEGKQPPPMTVIETDGGKLLVSDGHRRLAAAKLAGEKTVLAWVSPRMNTGKKTPDGKPIYVAATFEGMIQGPQTAQQLYNERQQKQLAAATQSYLDETGREIYVDEGRPGTYSFYRKTDTGRQRYNVRGTDKWYSSKGEAQKALDAMAVDKGWNRGTAAKKTVPQSALGTGTLWESNEERQRAAKAMGKLPAAEQAVNTEDSGAELTYNRRNRIRTGIKWDDIKDKNTALKVKETNKNNVYPKPDYQQMVEDGTDPMIAHIVKQVYDAIPTGPVTRGAITDEDMQHYITGVNRVMDAATKWANNKDAIASWARNQSRAAGAALGKPTSITDLAQSSKSLLDMVYPEGHKAHLDEIRVLGGNKLWRALQPGYEQGKRAMKEIKKGWPGKLESWQKQGYKIIEKKDVKISEGYRDVQDRPVYYVEIDDRAHGDRFYVKEEAQAAVEKLKPYILVDKYSRPISEYDTNEQALEAARETVKKDIKPRISEKGIAVEAAERIGAPRREEGENITSDKLRDTFGFKGVNFGNWMKGDANEAERQLHLNHAYDAFMDLAEILNVPPRALSLNGMLGVAIGAQGSGGAAAHFVPGVNEINLTRTAGAGSLSHELGHAVDHYFANQAGLAASREPFLTEHVETVGADGYTKRAGQKVKAFGDGIRPEIAALFKKIVDAMNQRAVTPEEHAKAQAERRDKTRQNIHSWLRSIKTDFMNQQVAEEDFDRLAERIKNLDLGAGRISVSGGFSMSPVVSELRDLYKAKTGRVYNLDQIKGVQANIDHYQYLVEKEKDLHIPQTTKRTNYSSAAARLDSKKSKPYWNTNLEKFARAFDAFISDTLEAKAEKNSYLSHAGRTGETVPQGEERTAINEAFQALVEEIQTRETNKGVEMYSFEEDAKIQKDTEAFSKQLDDYAAGKSRKDVPLTVGPTPYVLERLGAAQLPVVIDHATLDKCTKNKHGLTIEDLKRITEEINDPIMVFDSATESGKDSFVIMTSIIKGDRTVIVAVHLNKRVGRYFVNDVASVYPRSSNDHFLNWIDQGLLRYYHKGKARNWFMTRGLQLPKVRGTNPSRGNKILFNTDLVNRKNAQAAATEPSIPQRLDAGGLKSLVADLSGGLKGTLVTERGGRIYLKVRSGEEVSIDSVESINANQIQINGNYDPATVAGKKVAGMFASENGRFSITLSRSAKNAWTLSHEFFHFLEAIGAITNADKQILNRKISALLAKDAKGHAYLTGRSTAEQRAEYVGRMLAGLYDAKSPTGKILQKIREIIDRVVNAFGIRTAAGVIRDIQTGKIYQADDAVDNVIERAYTYPQGWHDEGLSVSDNGRGADRTASGPAGGVQYQPTVVGQEKIGTIKAPVRTIRRPQDAAQIAARYLSRYPDEHFLSFVLDGKGRVLHVYRHSIGVRGSSQGSISSLAGNALNTPNASKVILVHNHPGQSPKFSQEDRRFSQAVQNAVRSSGIEVMDFLAVTRNRYMSEREDDIGGVDLEAPVGKISIPLTARVFEQIHNGPSVSSPEIAQRQAQKYIPEGGVLYLDNVNALSGYSNITQYNQLRGAPQAELLRDLDRTNASGMIAYVPGRTVGIREANNLSAFAAALGGEIRLLDIIDESGALSQDGRMPQAMPTSSFYQLADETKTVQGKATAKGQKAEAVFAERITKPLGRLVSQGVSSLTGRAAPETRATIRKLAKHFNEFWKPFSTVPDGDKILAKRYQAMGNVARAVRFIDELKQKMAAWPDDIKKDVFWYLNGDIPIESIPEEARDLAKMIQRRTEVIGEMLVDRGILAEGQFAKYQGKYVHYLYAKHVLGDDAPIFLTSTGKLNLTYTKSRNPNMTLQQRKELGLIEDASVAVPVGMGKALTDIAKYDYLESIADNPDWVWQPSMINVPMGAPLKTPIKGRTRRFVKMGIGKLVEEVKIYDKMAAAHPSPEVSEIRDILRAALTKAEQASENMPDDFVQLPTSKGYGALAGAYVRKPIADDLMPVLDVATDRGKLMNTLLSIERQGMAGFKMGKVALNFPTAFRNVISNIIQNNMRGRPLSKIPGDIIRACESLKAKDTYYEEAFGMGLFHTNWFVSEINDVLDEFRKVQAGRIDQLMIAVKNVAKYYGKIDDINKLAIFIEQRKAGKPADEAALTAMKWGMDYSLTSRSIKGLRQTIVPFATYQYKIAPLIAESLKTRPWVLAKFALLYPAAKMLAMALHDLDDDDWEDLEKQLPAYIKKSGSMLILPWKSDKGQWQWVNLEYFFPWGNALAVFRDAKQMDSGETLRDLGISNPFLSMFYTGLSAREDQPPLHAYFGTPIYNELDPGWMKAAKYLEYMANTWAPSMLTRQGAIGYTGKALMGTEDRWGRTVSLPQAAGRWFGLNIVSVSPEQSRAQVSVKIQDLHKEMARIDANPSYSEDAKAAYRARMNEKLAELAEAAPSAVLPIVKAKGKDPVYDALREMAAQGILHSSPPSRSVEIGGIPSKMSMDQYREYLDRSSELARPRLQALVTSPRWEQLTDGRKAQLVSTIIANARKGVRQKIKAQMMRERRQQQQAQPAAGG